MKLQVKDTKPQVGIFEIVENQWLTSTEDVQNVSESGDYFDGIDLHLHAYEIPKLVQFNSNISNETKGKFKSNKYAYLDYPRGRVDYNTKDKTYHIMADKKFFTVENIENSGAVLILQNRDWNGGYYSRLDLSNGEIHIIWGPNSHQRVDVSTRALVEYNGRDYWVPAQPA